MDTAMRGQVGAAGQVAEAGADATVASRRRLLSAWTGLGAAVGAARTIAAGASGATGAAGVVGVGGVAALAAATSARGQDAPMDVDPGALIHRLVNRITFGLTQAELAQATSLGYAGYLEQQLNPDAIAEDPVLLDRLAALPTLSYSGAQLYDTGLVPSATQIVNELIEATILRAVYSRRQLFERMVEFWSDHFSIDINTEETRYLKTLDDRAIRQHALGSFPALLNASARSPAMLTYLDNDLSSSLSINENYARELIELHTVGADYFYSYPASAVQATIVAVARCFTGWGRYNSSFNDTAGGTGTALRGQFYYNTINLRNRVQINGSILGGVTAGAHDTGEKVLGTLFGSLEIPAGRTGAEGQQDGQEVLDALAAHPATAAYISRKMCKRFLGEGVAQSVIDRVAQEYLNASNPQGIGDIRAMLRVMLSPNTLAGAFPRFKRPFHLFVHSMRVLPTNISSTSSLRTRLATAGHLPFNWSPPDGYPDTTAYWTGQVLPRWNFCASLMTTTGGNPTGITGVTVDDAAFFSGATTPTAVMDRIDQALFGGLMPASERAVIQAGLSANPTATQRRDAVSQALSAPSFNWY